MSRQDVVEEGRAGRRTVLLLQGPPSRFWPELAAAFEAAGHRALHVNLCVADRLYWRGRPAIEYRGRLEDWPAALDAIVRREGVTDILYYADRLPYHRDAAAVAARHGIPAVAVEFGYLRPDWLTLERGGMGAGSHFPDDPDTIRAIAAGAPAPDLTVRYTHGFVQEAVNEIAFHLSNTLLGWLYPRYRGDRYYNAVLEYLSWLPRLVRQARAERHAAAVTADAAAGRWPYYLAALQLQSDYQIRANSPYRSVGAMIEDVVASFAAHAPADSRLVVKLHPLDNGMERWPALTREVAGRHGVGSRVALIDGGDLATLLRHARGCVLINSTVGLHAIRAGCPTKVLGIALFDVAGLTHQGPLDGFWADPAPVDASLADALVRALARTIQIKGSFYAPEGRRAGIEQIVRRVAAERVNEPGAYVQPPPRLERARRLGLPV